MQSYRQPGPVTAAIAAMRAAQPSADKIREISDLTTYASDLLVESIATTGEAGGVASAEAALEAIGILHAISSRLGVLSHQH